LVLKEEGDQAIFGSSLRGVAVQDYDWSHLNNVQLGRYAEYFVKMEFTRYGFDVYTAEVDDKGIDFVVRKEHSTEGGGVEYRYYDVQVKSTRGMNYVYLQQSKFKLRKNLLAAVVLFGTSRWPNLYLIRSTDWEHPNALVVDRKYKGGKTPPEWGLNLSRRNLPLLESYEFERIVKGL
jgi:hypothetical protein